MNTFKWGDAVRQIILTARRDRAQARANLGELRCRDAVNVPEEIAYET
jgi:hypothetical protein